MYDQNICAMQKFALTFCLQNTVWHRGCVLNYCWQLFSVFWSEELMNTGNDKIDDTLAYMKNLTLIV